MPDTVLCYFRLVCSCEVCRGGLFAVLVARGTCGLLLSMTVMDMVEGL